METMIVDTDTHVIEPPDVFTSRMSRRKWGDLIPEVKWCEEWQAEAWFVGGQPTFRAWDSAALDAAPGLGQGPKRIGEVHPACYDAAERVRGMDKHSISAAVLYPNLGLTGDIVPEHDRELSFEIIRARNDWLLDWVADTPTRFVPLACLPYWDVDEAVREAQRCAANGHRGVVTTAAPHLHDLPALGSPHWEPLWSVLEEASLSVSFHIASGKPMDNWDPAHALIEGPATSNARGSVCTFVDNCKYIVDLVFSGVLARHPNLNFITVESGISWIPFAMQASDHMYRKGKVWKERPELELLPSEYFKRQIYANYWFEKLEDYHLEYIGADHIFFETDFPHPCCLMGNDVQAALDHGLSAQPSEVRERIMWRNAAELFGIESLLSR